ncbi:alpha/beta hydrolase [Pelagicoccus sp. SDUM812002]|uniref:alpha/beta hydrolase n=1 Tax=Pelagicoccus sp. SDUM812002 TaxID=3041266 RepID=UPI00280F0A8D|nr:alpha/beta hydrolase [Pelagicoccus sp. SDUM812002]MDQ8185804.1 alpha/beta hydrolase [Pelagicoccus sp. SDUM812002]
MYIVTNRKLYEKRKGLDIFGKKPAEKKPNSNGHNELRLLKADKKGKGFQVSVLDEKLTKQEVVGLKNRHNLKIDEELNYYASLQVACEIFEKATENETPIVCYVHGYNNDVSDVLDTAANIEKTYKVIVIIFTWPANGGGKLSGAAAYLSDKRDARASAGALERFIGKLHDYHQLLTDSMRAEMKKKALAKAGGNEQRYRSLYGELLEGQCTVPITLACHSMGNYVLKHSLASTESAVRQLVFDNVLLLAADTNNEKHEDWANALQVRNRQYAVINEKDFALGWSRRKPGEEQLARLGHYLFNLTAKRTIYVDVTGAKGVGSSHGYFCGRAVEENKTLRDLFNKIFRGGSIESELQYRTEINAYRIP